MPTGREPNGYVDRLLDDLAGRLAARLPSPRPVVPTPEPPPALHVVEEAPAAAEDPPGPDEGMPDEEQPDERPPDDPAALAILADPRVAADLRRAARLPAASARPLEEVWRELEAG